MDAPVVLYLVINVKELIQGKEQHFQSVALPHDIIVPQGVALHGGCLKTGDALQFILPLIFCHVEKCPTKPPLEDRTQR